MKLTKDEMRAVRAMVMDEDEVDMALLEDLAERIYQDPKAGLMPEYKDGQWAKVLFMKHTDDMDDDYQEPVWVVAQFDAKLNLWVIFREAEGAPIQFVPPDMFMEAHLIEIINSNDSYGGKKK